VQEIRKRGQRFGKTEKQQTYDTASVDRSSIFVLKIYITSGGTGADSGTFCDHFWEFVKESTDEIAYSQASGGHTAVVNGYVGIGAVFVDFVFLDCGKSAGLAGEVGSV
jgi:hypothetical protein